MAPASEMNSLIGNFARGNFGRPLEQIVQTMNGVTEWYGHSSMGPGVVIGENRSEIPRVSTKLPFYELDKQVRRLAQAT